jgi:hypoxanthine-DNA glycosylase
MTRRINRLRGLPPVIDAGTRCLILGSFPGEASLAAQQYYGHPSNQFWPLLSCALVEPLVQLPYADRLRRLAARSIGLWDVLQACEREGSLDSAIRHARRNDFSGLRAIAPALRAVLFNGGTSGRFAARLAAEGFQVAILPSSSAAHAGRSFEQKLACWRPAVTRALG